MRVRSLRAPWPHDAAKRIPWPLRKAEEDHFEYAAGLVTGEVVFFSECSVEGAWVTFMGAEARPTLLPRPSDSYGEEARMPRGLTVQLRHIVWCADAPFDS